MSSIKNDIDVSIIDLSSKYNDNEEYLKILYSFIHNKLESYVFKLYQKQKKKKEKNIIIRSIISKLFQRYNTIYYNKHLDIFYHVDAGKFKNVNYDSLIIDIHKYIKENNPNLLTHKISIYNNFRKELTNRNMYDISIKKNTINKIKKIFDSIFLNETILEVFLFFIGLSLNNVEDELLQGNIIFYGDNTIEFIELLKYSIFEITKLYIRPLSDIKFKYNHYDLKTCKLFYININNFHYFKQTFNDNKELFVLVCNHIYHEKKNSDIRQIQGTEPIFFMNQFINKEDIFHYYMEHYIVEDCEMHVKKSDIVIDFNLFLLKENLPSNMISKKDLEAFIQKYFRKNSMYRNSYHISLIQFNKINCCMDFVKDKLVKQDSNIISLDDLYFFFKVWFEKKEISYSCFSKQDLKNMFISLYFSFENNYIYNYNILEFNKKDICKQFQYTHIQSKEGEDIILLDLKLYFDNWYVSNYRDYPLFDLFTIKYYFSLLLGDYNPYILGWKNYIIINT